MCRFKSEDYGIVSIQHRKGLYSNFLREFLILDVVPFIPGTNISQNDPIHTYIEVCRSQRYGSSTFLGIWRLAQDDVVILRKEDETAVSGQGNPTSQDCSYPHSELLGTISWNNRSGPTLLDMFTLISFLSLSLPDYNRFTCPCNWLARTVYSVSRRGFRAQVVLETPRNKLWKIARFLTSIPNQLLGPKLPPGLNNFCARLYFWNNLAIMEWQQQMEQQLAPGAGGY
ncbi:hypothetical protein OG21DRAFT_1486418 [Imleria badia]|nr:hypothetical protein OG21DRAFT_1486418 [Imleria badia]